MALLSDEYLALVADPGRELDGSIRLIAAQCAIELQGLKKKIAQDQDKLALISNKVNHLVGSIALNEPLIEIQRILHGMR